MREMTIRKRDFLAGLLALPAGGLAKAAGRDEFRLPSSLASPTLATGGLFKDFGGFAVPDEIGVIQTSGFSIVGKGAARYKRSSDLPVWGKGKWWAADAHGNQWELAEAEPETDMFGTVGDARTGEPRAGGVIIAATALMATAAGTDVTREIQDCVDYCLSKGIKEARLSEGRHLTSGPIHLGYGDVFASVNLVGRGQRYSTWDQQFGGSAIIATHSNAPILVIQGAREVYIRSLTLYGLYANWVAANNLASNSSTEALALDDSNIEVWSSPALHPNQDTRYTPFAGVAIDPYSGPRPPISYPDVAYPKWTGVLTQYGKKSSSQVTLEDVHIIGVTAGLAVQPSDSDSNGDFVKMVRCSVEYSKYMISIGNSQSRNVGVDNCTFNRVHTLFEGRTHGRQVGRFQGTIDNLSGSSCIQLLNLVAGYALPMSFSGLYCEGAWRIGNLIGSNAGSLLFCACYFSFAMPVRDNSRGQPANHLSGSTRRHNGIAVCQAPVRFLACRISVESVVVLCAQDVSFDGEIRPIERDIGSVAPYEAYAHNGLAGGLVIYDFGDGPSSAVNVSCRYKQIDGTTGIVGSDVSILNNRFRCSALARKYGAPLYATRIEPSAHGTAVEVRQKPAQLNKSSFGQSTRAGRAVTLTSPNPPARSERTGERPGDVWIDRATGTVFFVTANDDSRRRITIRQQNNWKGNRGAETSGQIVDLASGQFECISTRLYTPDYPLIVDSRAGSAVLTNAGTANANTTSLTSGSPAVGDFIVLNNYEDNLVSEEGTTTITAMSASRRTITLSAEANESRTRERLTSFRAAPPANVRVS